jgi:hypothetical protein
MLKKFLGAAAAVAFVASAAAAAYTPGPLPAGTFGGGTVATNPDIFKAEQKAAGAGSKLAAATAKCYSKGAKNVSLAKPDGVAACIGTGNPSGKGALDKYAKTIAGLTDLPACNDYSANPGGDGDLIINLVKAFQPAVYCASPSGAFVDGSAGL